jgi:flagellar biosynthesis protein FlhF
MRIRRFQAPDMRTALRMVREEQGENAVILSSERCGDGIEVVAATDYDEALVRRALRGEMPTPPADERPAPNFEAPGWPSPAVASPAPAWAAPAQEKPSNVTPIGGPVQPAAPSGRARFDVPPGPEPMPRATPARAALAAGPISFAAHLRSAVPADEPAPFTALHELELAREPLLSALMERLIDPPAPAASVPHAAPAAPVPQSATAPVAAVAPVPQPVDVASAAAATAAAPASDSAVRPALAAVPSPDPTVEALRQELAQMRTLIEREIGQFTDERLRGVPVRGAILQELHAYGCEAELARAVAASIPPNIEIGVARGRALALLAKSMVVAEREPIEDGGVIALVGPTGVGKTTTLAKLAARYAAAHSARDVALVTLDSYRIGAREQLAEFGRRLGMPVIDASRDGLAGTLERLADYPLVLVDTAGLGQRDRALAAQFNWISAARRVRSYLVLPANARNEDLDEVIRRFRCASPEGAILSKLDETGRLGGALSVLIRQRLPLAYVTDGQRVPEDLHRAHAHRLVLRLGELHRAAQDDHDDGDQKHAVA